MKISNILALSSPNDIVFFDLETTGVNTSTDRIVQIALIKIKQSGEIENKCVTINPEMNIPKEASDIHGITNEMVLDAPKFRQIAKSFNDFISGCDLAGYNSNRFDLPLLVKEFERAGIEFEFNHEKNKIVDIFKIYCNFKKRDLSTCFQEYTGKVMEDAHDAANDAIATIEILESMFAIHGDEMKNDDFYKIQSHDLSGFLFKNDQGQVCFNFGKNKGIPLKQDRKYCDWVLNQDFPLQTKKLIIKELNTY